MSKCQSPVSEQQCQPEPEVSSIWDVFEQVQGNAAQQDVLASGMDPDLEEDDAALTSAPDALQELCAASDPMAEAMLSDPELQEAFGASDLSPLALLSELLPDATDQQLDLSGADKDCPPEAEQAPNQIQLAPYSRITNEQQALINGFTDASHRAMAAWGTEREEEEPQFDASRLEAVLAQFEVDFAGLPSKQLLPDGSTLMLDQGPLSFWNHEPAQAEVKRQLCSGPFTHYLSEVYGRDPGALGLGRYASLVGGVALEAVAVRDEEGKGVHHYEFLWSAVSADVGIANNGVGGVVVQGKLHYTHPSGKMWVKPITMWLGAGSVGYGKGSLVNMNVEDGTAAADSVIYYDESYFDISTAMMMSAGANVSGYEEQAFSTVFIGDLELNPSGGGKWGTSWASVGVNGEARFGTSLGGEAFESGGVDGEGAVPARQEQRAPRDDRSEVFLSADIHFRTDESELDGEDAATIEQLLDALDQHEQAFPGDVATITAEGVASPRFDHPRTAASRRHPDQADALADFDEETVGRILNDDLALQRAQTVIGSLRDGLLETAPSLKVIEHLSTRIGDGTCGPDEAEDRAVHLEVLYKPSPAGNKAAMEGHHNAEDVDPYTGEIVKRRSPALDVRK